MEKLTEAEKTLLLGGLDLTVSVLSNELNKAQKNEDRTMLRNKMLEALVLSEKIQKIK